MIIVNNTAINYIECLMLMFPTWKKQGCGFDLYSFNGNTFDEHCTNKIEAIKQSLIKHKGQNVLYLDTDVMMMDKISEDVFTQDIMVTRMVHRSDKGGLKDINAGVSFWRANDRTIRFCDEWLALDKQYQGKHRFPEQKAFNDLCYKYFDSCADISIGVLSERLYNFEHDNIKTFFDWIPKYRPKLIHLKSKRWAVEGVVERLKSCIVL